MKSAATIALFVSAAFPQFSDADWGRSAKYEVAEQRIAGTTWIADDGPLGQVTYYFDPSGDLVYTYANGRQFRNGTWKWRGRELYFEANRQYREFRATVRGSRMTGSSWNKAGLQWQTNMIRKSN